MALATMARQWQCNHPDDVVITSVAADLPITLRADGCNPLLGTVLTAMITLIPRGLSVTGSATSASA